MKQRAAESTRWLREIDRRNFIRLSSLAVGGAALGACGGGSAAAADPTGPEPPVPPEPPPPPPNPPPAAQVAAVRGGNLYDMTRDVLDALGGIEEVVHEGETVFIKPNMVTLPWAASGNVFANGECTKPEICIAVAEECLRAGASEVIVGDGSQMPTLEWQYALALDGSENLLQAAERLSSQYAGTVSVASLEVDSPSWVTVPSSTYLGTIGVSSLVARADRVITVPVAKTHCWAQLTLALKNFVGVTPLSWYAGEVNGYWDRGAEFDHSSTRSIAEIYLDVVAGVEPDLAIVDFSIGIEGDGPAIGHGGRTVDMRNRLGSFLLLASTDPVAADATAARVMSHNPYGVTQLRLAYERGMGQILEGEIEMIGERLEDLIVEWDPAGLRNRLSSCPFGAPAFAAARQRRRTRKHA